MYLYKLKMLFDGDPGHLINKNKINNIQMKSKRSKYVIVAHSYVYTYVHTCVPLIVPLDQAVQ